MQSQNKNLLLKIIAPNQDLLIEDNVDRVRLHLSNDTYISIYPNHAPLIALVKCGTLEYNMDSLTEYIDIKQGLLEVKDNTVLILTEGKSSQTNINENV